ncbi:hypothetical protein M441DRAFT_49016 [Trichoderma asperellum CBS 433.97]|uniref:WW domain-containing protein n=1 Tax=Trichoderma asperellum (strain ATCC 204424 / CBS 433.97 / NBRC 101777) TaxID=1042311 RepID=A0A2T3Z1D2_TRIA4|nr:hypothetical protein M441DRAFT_49016 [Trichoderma asperellum CBS 433.97]PTB38624.1 hypothetical protein M441DRAFT_49016 [Trichoderma asperellum CBS 433.97]
MSGTTSPSNKGPAFAPPQLSAGWIAQWDGASRKYSYIQLSTGVSQWEIPTQAPELITHPDGLQTVKRVDGMIEPILPDGMDGPNRDRGLGSMAVNALLSAKNG